MVEEKITRLIIILARKTESRSIIWEPTARRSKLLANLGSSSVSIQEFDEDEYTMAHIRVAILDEEGIEVESMEIYSNNEFWKQTSQLATLARRNAFNVEGRLDALLQELEETP